MAQPSPPVQARPPKPGAETATLPAWLTSIGLHAILLGTLWYAGQEAPRGASAEPLRQVGIVLKQSDDQEDRFVGEEEATQPTSTAEAVDSSDWLPSEADLPSIPAPSTSAEDSGDAQSDAPGAPPGASSGGGRPRFLGNKARVSVFGVEGVGTRFVYVFDRSVSMEGRPLEAAKRQLLASLESLDSVHQFQIIFFNHQPSAFDLTGGQRRIAFATDRNKRLAERFVRGISANGGTYRRLALANGLALSPDVIFFLTDVDDPMSEADVAAAVAQANNSGTSINTIEFGLANKPVGRNFLARLSEATGGSYGYVSLADLGSGRPAQELRRP